MSSHPSRALRTPSTGCEVTRRGARCGRARAAALLTALLPHGPPLGACACPRASPPPAAPGSCAPPPPVRRAVPAGRAARRATGRRPGPRGRCGALKSAGVTASRSSHATGNDTGAPGRARGLYTATSVAPPARVGSTNTLPPRSSLMNAVVATSGSSSAARAATALVAAAASSSATSPASGTTTCRPFAPLVFTAAASPTPSSAARTSRAAATAAAKSAPGGGSRSSTSRDAWCSPTRSMLGWYSTARWLANQSSVRRSSHSA